MNVTLSLSKPLILESIKAETFIKGNIDAAVDDKAKEMAYQEEAGDNEYHERKLNRSIYNSLDRLCSIIIPFLNSRVDYSTTGDNYYNVTEQVIEIFLDIPDNYNAKMLDSLARLCSKYIEDHSLFLWWGTFNQNQAAFYAQLAESDLANIKNAFVKPKPRTVPIPYTSSLELDGIGTTIDLSVGESAGITYIIDDGCIDDIDCRIYDWKCFRVSRGKRKFVLKALFKGIYKVTLFSRHDEDVKKELTVRVTEE